MVEMGCLCCGAGPEIGALCRSCASQLGSYDSLIPDHLHSRVDSTEAEGWVVDGWGGAHALAPRTSIGRNHDCELVVLASSVSRDHAELVQTESGWTVRDLGSRNGTFVNGVRTQDAVALPTRALLKVGDITLWFLAEVFPEPPGRPTMATGGIDGRLARYELVYRDIELCVVVSDDTTGGGAALWRAVGAETWSERNLAPLEFQLLRALCIRAHAEAGSPSAVRGCVPTKQLVAELPFQSKYANQENVRQVVLRLRGVLAEIGLPGVLAVAPGRGYYLACSVTLASSVTGSR